MFSRRHDRRAAHRAKHRAATPPSEPPRHAAEPRAEPPRFAAPHRAARALDANSADAENHASTVAINGGAVLAKLTENFGPNYELVGVSYANVALYP